MFHPEVQEIQHLFGHNEKKVYMYGHWDKSEKGLLKLTRRAPWLVMKGQSNKNARIGGWEKQQSWFSKNLRRRRAKNKVAKESRRKNRK